MTFLSTALDASEEDVEAVVQPICNGETVEELGDFNFFITFLIEEGELTEEELVEANVMKIEPLSICVPKKPMKASNYITKTLNNENVLKNGLVQTKVEYNGTTYDAGIRYTGTMDEVKNKVYYNCEDTDTNGVSYGSENYDYSSSCEVWRIIGVFDTKTSTSGSTEKRVKIINTNSTFEASWDSGADDVNDGIGANQWGESGDYEGADLMRLLNGYYINAPESTCTYCNDRGQEICSQTCTAESLKSANMKVLTNTAKGMIENAVWDTYGVKWPEDGVTNSSFVTTAYLEEKGISAQNTGKICTSVGSCNDSVARTTNWTGLVGLMSVSDVLYANGWLYNQEGTELSPWLITPLIMTDVPYYIWVSYIDSLFHGLTYFETEVFPTVYLKSDIEIIGGDGNTEPFKIK